MMETSKPVPFHEALRFWIKLGFINFGGPTGQIAIMHTELVEKKKWISEESFLHALNYCMLLPGPEAHQLAIYVGWLLHKARGGIAAGAFFVIPSIFILWLLSFVYVVYGYTFWISSIFYGLKAAVIAIVAAAVIRIGRRALKTPFLYSIAALSFVCIFFLKISFPLIILSAGLLGLILGKVQSQNKVLEISSTSSDPAAIPVKNSAGRALRIVLIWIAVWWTPVVMIGLLLGKNHVAFQEGVFFSKAAMVTFGGAYAVLPYVSQQAVERFHWLSATQVIDGLGLAETTPGPLIIVVQFIAFLGGWNHPGSLPPLLSASLGAFISTWVTFLPSFLWIFLGAPYVEQLRSKTFLKSAMTSITAAVVGVVLNLAVWFAIHSLFPGNTIDWFILVVSLVTFLVLMRWNPPVPYVVLAASALGLIYRSIVA